MTNNAQRAIYTYDAAGRLTGLTYFNGTLTTYGYDNANRLTSLENRKSDTSVIATYQFTLDGNGNRTQGVQSEPLVPVIPVGTTTYTYNTQKNRLLSAGPVNFGYDNEGQLSSGYGSSYTFDYEHRLIGIGSSYQFLYEGSGNRLQAVRSGVVTRYIYGGGGNLLAEADGQNNITRYYIYGLGLLAMVTPSDQVYCYHFNAIGSTIAMTDQTQAMVNKYAHEPFGNIANRVEAVTQPFKFVGQLGVMTEPNGFYYMRARYYDPEVGRFISEDPIGFEGGDVNLMAYVSNNPILLIDPDGEWGQIIAGAIYGGISGFSAGALKGNIWAGIAGGVAGGVVGAAIGTVMPAASGYVGSMVGGAISGMIGGAAAGGVASAISGTNITKGVATGAAVGLISGAVAGPVGYLVKQGVGTAIASQSPELLNTVSSIAQANLLSVVKTSAYVGMAAIGK